MELGFKTGYHTPTSLKMPSDSLIHNALQLAFQSKCFAGLTPSHGGVRSRNFSNFTLVYLFLYEYESINANLNDMGCS